MKISFILQITGKYYKVILLTPLLFIFLLLMINTLRIFPRVMSALSVFNPTNSMVFAPDSVKLRHKTNPIVLDYYEFVKRNTPEDAVILIPPTAYPWPMSGNANYSRYFLYPRYLIPGKENEPGVDLKKENVQYALVIWGETDSTSPGYTHGWPKFFLPAKQIIYKKPTSNFFNYDKLVFTKDFSPDDIKKEYWGVIEIDRSRL